jgi:hypothetical protein
LIQTLPARTLLASLCGLGEIVGPDVGRQSVACVVGEFDRRIDIIERKHEPNRSKDLLASDPDIAAAAREHCRLHEEAATIDARAARNQIRPVRPTVIYALRHSRELAVVDKCPHRRSLIERAADNDIGRRTREALYDGVVVPARHEHACARGADLTLVGKDPDRDTRHHGVEVRVVENCLRRLSAELKWHHR